MTAGRIALWGAGITALTGLAPLPVRAQAVLASSIYQFAGYTGAGRNDGSSPVGGTLVDRANPAIIYGTTAAGGQYNAGAVYATTGAPGATLHTRILYSFTADPDLGAPTGRLYQDAAGALYGGAIAGGKHRNGGIYKITPPAAGSDQWTETVLHSFGSRGTIGADFNVSGLVADAAGNLFGTLFAGRGTVFEITPSGRYAPIHSFNGPDGQGPTSPITIGPDGTLYGVTGYGGSHACGFYGCGTVYMLSPPTEDAPWQFATIYSFESGLHGQLPYGPVAIGRDGSVFGTNYTHGDARQAGSLPGTVFRVFKATATAPAHAAAVYVFPVGKPYNGVRFDSAGGIYGSYFTGFGHQHDFYLKPDAPGSYHYSTLTDLYTRVSVSISTDGVTVTQPVPGGDVVLDDVDEEGYPSDHTINGAVYRLRIKP